MVHSFTKPRGPFWCHSPKKQRVSEKGESLRSRGQARVVGELLTPDAYFFPKKNLESTPERTETPLSRGTTYTHRRSALRQKESTMPQIQYSEKYYDDIYEYRCVCETSRSPTTLFFYTAGCGKETKKKDSGMGGGSRCLFGGKPKNNTRGLLL